MKNKAAAKVFRVGALLTLSLQGSSLPGQGTAFTYQGQHIGPMAQDFYAAFNIGTDDKHIAPIDEAGVMLAAIQGLNQKLTDELNRRDAENVELKQRLEALEKIVHNR